jgi:ABC-type multidrug transport system fused ATPase/permease subunit
MEAIEMDEKIMYVLNGLKKFAIYLVIPAGAIVILPDNWLGYFHLLEAKNQFADYVSVLFFISLSIVIVDSIASFMNIIIEIIGQGIMCRNRERIFDTLNDEEWKILILIYLNDSYQFDANDASVNLLTSQQMILCPNISKGWTTFSYSLQPWVREYFTKNQNVVDDFVNKQTELLNKRT